MQFNTIIPIVLTLAGIVSAKLSVLSPMATSIWGHNSVQTIKWTTLLDEGITATKLSLYLVCEHKGVTTVLFPIKENLACTSNEINYQVPTSVRQCEGYFLKFVSYNTCGLKQTFFSGMFYITVDGTHKQLGTCESGPGTPDKLLPGPKEGETTPDHPKDDTPTVTQTHTDDIPSLPTEPTESQTPITPGDGDHPGITVPGVGEPTTSPSPSPEKKPDLDNHGTVVTFKLFGILLTTITVLIFS